MSSFPSAYCTSTHGSCSQERIDHAVLIRWTKGFGADNTEGKNVAEMFQHALDRYVRTILPSFVDRNTEDTTMFVASTRSPYRRHQRYDRNAHRLVLRQPEDAYRRHLRYRLQCGLHGAHRRHPQARSPRPRSERTHGDQLRVGECILDPSGLSKGGPS